MNKISEIRESMVNFVKSKYSQLTNLQKLVLGIFFVVLFFILTIILGNFRDDLNEEIDYDEYNGEMFYTIGTKIDNNTYATLNNISNSLIQKYTRLGDYKTEKANFYEDYEGCVYNLFKKKFSEKKYFELIKNVYTNISKSVNVNGDIVPDNILCYKDDFYILKYSYIDEENTTINSYVGLCLDTLNKKFYIWYLE